MKSFTAIALAAYVANATSIELTPHKYASYQAPKSTRSYGGYGS